MLDREVLEEEVRSRLAPLEPLRRRVVRVYWMRGLLALLTLAAAAGLALAASVAAALWVLQAPSSAEQGGVGAHVLRLLVALVGPLALIAPGAAVLVAATLRGFGRSTVLEHEQRFRTEVVAPLLRSLLPEARLTLDGRVAEAPIRASRLFGEPRGDAFGELLVEGSAGGVAFAVSTLRVPVPRRQLLRRRSFSGLFGHIDIPGRFDDALLLPQASGGRRSEWPRPPADLQPLALGDPELRARFVLYARDPSRAAQLPAALRTLLLELAGRAVARLCVSLHGGGVAIALPLQRPLSPQRVRPDAPARLVREAVLYRLIYEAAAALASPLL